MACLPRFVELPSLNPDQFAKEDFKPAYAIQEEKISHLKSFEFKSQVKNSLVDGDAVRVWAKGNPLAAVRTQLEPGFVVHSVHRVSLELEQTGGCFWEILKKGEDIVSLRSPHAGGCFLTSRWTTCTKSGAKNFYLAAVDFTVTNKELWRIKHMQMSNNRMHCVLQNTRQKQHKIRVDIEACGSFGLIKSHDRIQKSDSSCGSSSTKENQPTIPAEKYLGPKSKQDNHLQSLEEKAEGTYLVHRDTNVFTALAARGVDSIHHAVPGDQHEEKISFSHGALGASAIYPDNIYALLRAHQERKLFNIERETSNALVGRALIGWLRVSKAQRLMKYEELIREY